METINETGQSLLFVDNNFPDGLKFEAETWVPEDDGNMVPLVDISVLRAIMHQYGWRDAEILNHQKDGVLFVRRFWDGASDTIKMAPVHALTYNAGLLSQLGISFSEIG